VDHTRLAIEDELGCLLREQPTEDYGIDARAEVVNAEMVRERLALHIKVARAGSRNRSQTAGGFQPDVKHVQYWTNHSLPALVVRRVCMTTAPRGRASGREYA
jgi:hypothetical protein